MDRPALRRYMRFLADEYTELPEGVIDDESADKFDLNDLINLAQVNVELELIPDIPHYFRKTFLISLEANKADYSMSSDLSISDCLAVEDLYHNETGRRPDGLLYVEKDQLAEHVTVGETGTPRVWSLEAENTIVFGPTPDQALSNRFKGYYFYEIPDLNNDSHNPPSQIAIPSIPKVAHPLISIDGIKQLCIMMEEEAGDIDKLYTNELRLIRRQLFTIGPSVTERRRLELKERIR